MCGRLDIFDTETLAPEGLGFTRGFVNWFKTPSGHLYKEVSYTECSNAQNKGASAVIELEGQLVPWYIDIENGIAAL